MHHQEIVLGRDGQVFSYDPPDGRPAAEPAPTVTVSDAHRLVPATTGACTVETIETSLRYAIGMGSVRLVAAGLVPNRRYLITDPGGDQERIDVAAVSGDRVTLRHPVVHSFAAGSALTAARISVAVDPAWAANAGNLSERSSGAGFAAYRLRWTYTLDDHEVTGLGYADLVMHPAGELVTPTDVDKRFPGFIANLPFEHRANQGADFIAEAFTAVRLEAAADHIAIRRIRDATVLRELVPIRACLIKVEHEVMHGAPLAVELADLQRRYERNFQRLLHRHPGEPAPPTVKAIGTQPGTPRPTNIQLPTPFPPKLTKG